MKKQKVLEIIDEVMNNREIDSIRNAILAIRDKVIEAPEYDEPITLELRGNNSLVECGPWFDGAKYVTIDVNEKVTTNCYGTIYYE